MKPNPSPQSDTLITPRTTAGPFKDFIPQKGRAWAELNWRQVTHFRTYPRRMALHIRPWQVAVSWSCFSIMSHIIHSDGDKMVAAKVP